MALIPLLPLFCMAGILVMAVLGLMSLVAPPGALDLPKQKLALELTNEKIAALLYEDGDATKARDLSPEEETRADALEKEAKGYRESIEATEAKAAKLAARSAAHQASVAFLKVTPPHKPADTEDEKAALTHIHENAKDDLKGGFRDYGDFVAMTVRGSQEHGIPTAWMNRPEVKGAYGQNTFNGEDGGFLVPVEFSNRIFERVTVGLPILEQTDRLTLAGNTIEITGMSDHDRNGTTYRYAGVIIYYVGEGGQITRSNLKFRKIKLSLNKLAALSFVTEEEMSDANVNFGQRLLEKHALGIREELIENVMFGTGAGQPLGAFSANSTAVITAAKETDQAADTVVLENVFEMEQQLWSPSDTRAIFLYNRELRKQLRLLKQDIGTGGSPVGLFERGRGESADMLDGYPAYATEHCEKAGDLGDFCLGDFSQYILATKGTTQTAMSQHLRFDYDETAFRSTFRVDGRPAWDQSFRPRKGASAKREAPFVKLIAR